MKSDKPNQKTNWRKWPMSLPMASDEVIRHLSLEIKQEIAKTPESGLLGLWSEYGQFVRNSLGLWNYFKNHEDISPHPDFMSYEIIKNVWVILQAKQQAKSL